MSLRLVRVLTKKHSGPSSRVGVIPTITQQFTSSGLGYDINAGLPVHGALVKAVPSPPLSAICLSRWLTTQPASAAGQTQQNLLE